MLKMKYVVTISVIALLLVFLFVYNPIKLFEKDNVFITTIGISAVTEKHCNDEGFFLTVNLADYTIAEYKLSYEYISFNVTDSIYNSITIEDSYVGATLRVTIPNIEEQMDIGTVLDGKFINYCQIISITTTDNEVIQ